MDHSGKQIVQQVIRQLRREKCQCIRCIQDHQTHCSNIANGTILWNYTIGRIPVCQECRHRHKYHTYKPYAK